jgi:flavin reductase (DIM6/NTAB) family NADH-FMN oxidoreductase RutF
VDISDINLYDWNNGKGGIHMEHMQVIDPKNLTDNVFKAIGSDWMLITAGTPGHWNTMTASWGGMGVLWNKNVVFCVIRPGRHTFGFMEKNDTFSLSFFDDAWRDALNLCGTESGRDIDKAAATGLIPMPGKFGTVVFEQARLVMECKKLYWQDVNPDSFLDSKLMGHYPIRDFHRMYFAEILECRRTACPT